MGVKARPCTIVSGRERTPTAATKPWIKSGASLAASPIKGEGIYRTKRYWKFSVSVFPT